MDISDNDFMQRCFELAKLGGSATRSNPNVGSIIVLDDKIIAEGYHAQFGGIHAERAALQNVANQHLSRLHEATLYVSLEPCCIHGKTPPCTDAIIESRIKNVVISTLDPNPLMNGRSLQLLQDHGITVKTGVMKSIGECILKPFQAHLKKRPYIILKFAQSVEGYMGKRGKQIWLSNNYSKIKSHKWRSECDAILVGHNTVLFDNPSLTTRLVPGENPLRIIIDHQLSLSHNYLVWQDEHKSLFVSHVSGHTQDKNKEIIMVSDDDSYWHKLMNILFEKGIYYLLVEGGAKTLQAFIKENLWDEARIVRTEQKLITGIRAPTLKGRLFKQEELETDRIDYLYRI